MNALLQVQKAIHEQAKEAVLAAKAKDAQSNTGKDAEKTKQPEETAAAITMSRSPGAEADANEKQMGNPTDLTSGFWGWKGKCSEDGAAGTDCFYFDLKLAQDGNALAYQRRFDPSANYLYNKSVFRIGRWSTKDDKIEILNNDGESILVATVTTGAVVLPDGRRFEHREKLTTPPPSAEESSFSKYFIQAP